MMMECIVKWDNLFLFKFLPLLFTVVSFIDRTNALDCPLRFPYAYYGGRHCCQDNKEKAAYEQRGSYQDSFCDGSVLTLESKCCKDDQYARCSGASCATPSFENDPCSADYPYPYYNGLYCCKTAKEKVAFVHRPAGTACQNGVLTLDSRCCENNGFVQCVNPPCVTMGYWSLTWNAEGNDNTNDPNFSRKLRVPSRRGVTIGRGYDMKARIGSFIKNDLIAAGVSDADATALSSGEQKIGAVATAFITSNNLQTFTLTHVQQWKLFKINLELQIERIKHIYGRSDLTTVDFDTTHDAIKGLVLDLYITGDYSQANIQLLHSKIWSNDVTALKDIMIVKSNWANVPQDRFDLRKTYMEKAAASFP